MVRQVVYTSTLLGDEGARKSTLAQIRQSSQRNNPLRNISGALFVAGPLAIQFLEGPAGEVKELLTILYKDPRHQGIVVLHDGESSTASMPEWAMATRDVSEAQRTKSEILSLVDSYRRTFRFSLPDLLIIVQAHLRLPL